MKRLTLPLQPEHKLVRWANSIRIFYGHPIYLVGSQLEPNCFVDELNCAEFTQKIETEIEPSDIDIVCIIPDKEFELRYGPYGKFCDESCTGIYTEECTWKWSDDNIKRSLSGMVETGLAIDFKVYPEQHSWSFEDKPKIRLDTRETIDKQYMSMVDIGDSFKSMLFCAYLTGQTDIRHKHAGLERRSFKDWFHDNYEIPEQR